MSTDEEPPLSGRSPLSARLLAYGESVALERRLKLVEKIAANAIGEEEIALPASFEERDAPLSPVVFTRDGERKDTGSPRVGDVRVLEPPPQSTKPSRPMIQQPRLNTSDNGLFRLYFSRELSRTLVRKYVKAQDHQCSGRRLYFQKFIDT